MNWELLDSFSYMIELWLQDFFVAYMGYIVLKFDDMWQGSYICTQIVLMLYPW